MKKRPRRRSHVLLLVAFILFGAVYYFATFKLMSINRAFQRERAAFTGLSSQVERLRGAVTPVPAETPAPPASHAPDATPEPTPRVILPWYRELHAGNPDMFGWLRIEDTVIDYPVMYTPEEPERYLERSFERGYSPWGVPFVDADCPEDGNFYLIYAHHMQDKSMFGVLPRYAEPEFYQKHKIICFDTLYEERRYEVMAAFTSRIYGVNEKGGFRYYQYTDLTDPAVFAEYVAEVKAAAAIETGVTAEYGDELIALSTCNYHTSNGRFVVVAKRIA